MKIFVRLIINSLIFLKRPKQRFGKWIINNSIGTINNSNPKQEQGHFGIRIHLENELEYDLA